MLNVFVAVGGSATRVADALVNLVSIGVPLNNKVLIWRIDPDKNSAASNSLDSSILNYNNILHELERWGKEIEIRHLDPLELRGITHKTLKGLLDTGGADVVSSMPILQCFYDDVALNYNLDAGFGQKPWIGSAVMAVFVKELLEGKADQTTSKKAKMDEIMNENEVRFFICGSLHGGAGASGLPIIAKALKEKRDKEKKNWQILGGLLAPYAIMPPPPIEAEPNISQSEIQKRISELRKSALWLNDPAFKDLSEQAKEELARDLLTGFYAEPRKIQERAIQALNYYVEFGSKFFDKWILLGKHQPDTLPFWSNGSKSQSNPMNSVEVNAALCALDFFENKIENQKNECNLLVVNDYEDNKGMNLTHTLKYKSKLNIFKHEVDIELEKVVVVTCVLFYFLNFHMPWEEHAENWNDKAKGFYEWIDGKEEKKITLKNSITKSFDYIKTSLTNLFSNEKNENGYKLTQGWDDSLYNDIKLLFSKNDRISRAIRPSSIFIIWKPEPIQISGRTIEFREDKILAKSSSKEIGKNIVLSGVFKDQDKGFVIKATWEGLYKDSSFGR
jgi:hypothetical protein